MKWSRSSEEEEKGVFDWKVYYFKLRYRVGDGESIKY